MTTLHLLQTPESIISTLIELGIITGSLGLILVRKIIYSALLLGFVFICVALLYLMLDADFLAASQVLIYVGAVNVLIVFCIMLVGTSSNSTIHSPKPAYLVSGFLLSILFAFLNVIIMNTSWTCTSCPLTLEGNPNSNTAETIGLHLLTDMLIPFELTSILLLIALIGAIVIASREVLKGREPT